MARRLKHQLALDQLRPYVSVLFYDLRTAARTAGEIFAVVTANLTSIVGEAHEKGGHLGEIIPIGLERKGRWDILGCWYGLETLPSWIARIEAAALPYDLQHHLTLFGIGSDPRRHDPFAFLLSTDKPVKKGVVKLLDDLALRRVSEEELVPTFLKGASRKAWLRGVHQPTAVKADAKTLAGPDLREAIDPIGDQSFRLDAAISDIRSARIVSDFRRGLPATSKLRELTDIDAVGRPPAKRRNELVGLSLRLGTLWTGATENFSDFLREIDELCDQITKSREAASAATGYEQPGYNLLARPEEDLTLDRLGEAVDFSIDMPLPKQEQRLQDSDSDVHAVQEWLEHGEFLFNRAEDERLFVDAVYDGRVIAEVRLQPILAAKGKAKLDLTALNRPETRQEEIDRLEAVLKGAEERTTIWFSNGFALQAHDLYNLQYRDIPFTGWKWMPFKKDKLAYEVHKEKPVNYRLWEAKWNGRSLFEFVVNNVELLFRPSKEWYLICDDGSSEIADFVFLDPEARLLRLIHIKAGKGDTARIAPAKYEIVISQATKNLRFLDPAMLAQRLESPQSARTAELTWISGAKAPNRVRAIAALKKMGAYLDRGVVVLQPHTTRSGWTTAEEKLRAGTLSDGDRIQLLRLRMMLADFGDVCRRFNATFEAWGVNDGADDGGAFARAKLR